ncbi:MAG TPA: CHAT domain-containing protein [Burkholderiaceae bacterium]|nr:CHAT domain-containing protein [Burkholderiaceae bacterium]HRZ01740.1 CHAT domain-containing protein [Burkholderiaceae bacterium]
MAQDPPATSRIRFVVPGQAEGGTRGAGVAAHTQDVRIRLGARRGAGEEVRVEADPAADLVVLSLADGPQLRLNPATAQLLFEAQTGGQTRGAADGVTVPARLAWAGAPQAAGGTRGLLGEVLLQTFEILRGKAADVAADKLAAKVDGQVDEGVYALEPGGLPRLKDSGRKLAAIPAPAQVDAPILVLVHGTFVETTSTFGKLWAQHPEAVQRLFDHYGGRVYALDHRTLGATPLDNALSLAQALPKGARVHLLTHSRGGLVGDALARACAPETLGPDPAAGLAGKDYATHRAQLKKLIELAAAKQLRVERMVRVACPARGTLLASKRLDAYLSVFKWLLELARIPVLPMLVEFLDDVARKRLDPAALPGLEAMLPDGAFVKWLHGAEDALPGQLRVVAGDLEGDTLGSWLKTLLSDAFYWTDNDLVVQTRSMYGGSPRAAEASFFLDRGRAVTHFNYFVNASTVEAMVAGLTQDRPTAFRTIGPLSWSGQDASGIRGGARAPGVAASARPALFLLPGILGSNLAVNGRRVWLSWRFFNNLDRLRWTGAPDAVTADGPIERIYGALGEYLADSHELIAFGYDWRRPVEHEARRLAEAIDAALEARRGSGQPVRIIAHSMGGVLARTVQLERPEVWRRFMSRPGARLLMLGTPNGGSWSPMQVLSGDDTFGNALASFGALFQDSEARRWMAEMPGFLQLQAALTDPQLGLGRAAEWQRLADEDAAAVQRHAAWHSLGVQRLATAWGVPPQAVLDAAAALRQRLDAQARAPEFAADIARIPLVAGLAERTPVGMRLTPAGLQYLEALDGDGRVPFDSAVLPGQRTWQARAVHGDLPGVRAAFAGYLQLLETGETNCEALRPLVAAGGSRGAAAAPAEAPIEVRPARLPGAAFVPPELADDLFSTPATAVVAAPPDRRLRVSIDNCNLLFVREPLLLGHYRSLALTGTERVVDGLLRGAMNAALQAGLYPDPPGAHQVFVNTVRNPEFPLQPPRPEAVIVAGLGEEGTLRPAELMRSVRQAVIAYAQRVSEQTAGGPTHFALAAALVGSGGSGITPGIAAQVIAQAVREANERLAQCEWPMVSHLRFIELYLERAAEAWRALSDQLAATPGLFELTAEIRLGRGALPRPVDSSYRGAEYDLVTAINPEEEQREADRRAGRPAAQAAAPDAGGTEAGGTIQYNLDSRRARNELRGQSVQLRLIRQLVKAAASDQNSNPHLGRTLFQLLVPVELEPFLNGSPALVMELDRTTAGVPWELLDLRSDGQSGATPWAIRCRLLRKLRTREFRRQPVGAGEDGGVLVIGAPQCDDKKYGPLPAAREEAEWVAKTLRDAGLRSAPVLLLDAEPLKIINELMARPYRIIHVSGHGDVGKEGNGVVLDDGLMLGAPEIEGMRTVPDLVFVNCCHLGRAETLTDPAAFAAGVAEALIGIGVRCVVAAGWAVDDAAARHFAASFYEELLRGSRFIDAIGVARESTWREYPASNTWAAYQCYGDPDWVFSAGRADVPGASRRRRDYGRSIASPSGLMLALQTIAVESEFDRSANGPAQRRETIARLEARFAPAWGARGDVSAAFGEAYTRARDAAAAMRWYERALVALDGSAPMNVAERLANLRARFAYEEMTRTLRDPQADKVAAAARAHEQIDRAIELLQRLAAIDASVERANLLGAAWKRRVLVARAAGQSELEAQALAKVLEHYREAEIKAGAAGSDEVFYPGMNRLAAELVTHFGEPAPRPVPDDEAQRLEAILARRADLDPSFWPFVQTVELRLYVALAKRSLAEVMSGARTQFEILRERVITPEEWKTVRDQANFVLGAYLKTGLASAEREAAQSLLDLLTGYAGD